MAKAMLTLVLLGMMTDPLMAQEPTVTSLMLKELTDIPGNADRTACPPTLHIAAVAPCGRV